MISISRRSPSVTRPQPGAADHGSMHALSSHSHDHIARLFGALPLALGKGTGSELRRPLGITIVGSLIVSQMLTLYTSPWSTWSSIISGAVSGAIVPAPTVPGKSRCRSIRATPVYCRWLRYGWRSRMRSRPEIIIRHPLRPRRLPTKNRPHSIKPATGGRSRSRTNQCSREMVGDF